MQGRWEHARASEWLIALHEHPEDEELAGRFDAWLAADPAHARDWAEISRTYDLLASLPPAHVEHGAIGQCQEAQDPDMVAAVSAGGGARRGSGAASRRLAYAAAAISLVVFVIFLMPSIRMFGSDAAYETRTGEMRTIALADGSSIRLAPESALTIEFTGAERGVRLLEGGAFFEVTADTARPFRVHTEILDTVVLGTAFEVRVGENAAEVAVRNGLVGVEGSGEPTLSARLAAGDWLRVSAEGNISRQHLPPSTIASWMQNRLIVRDRPVSEVVDLIRPYYDGVLLLRGKRLSQQPVTGIYDLSEPVAAIRSLARTHGADVLQVSPWLTLVVGD